MHFPASDPIRWLQACLALLGPLDAIKTATGVADLQQSTDLGDSEGWLCAFASPDGSEKLAVSFGASDIGASGDIYITSGAYSASVDFASDDAGTFQQHRQSITAWARQSLSHLTGG